MAGRTLNRRALREQADQAERDGAAPAADPSEAAPAKKKARAKAPAAPKPRKPKPKKAPPRLFAHWGVFDGGMKQVALFDYNQRAAADAKLAELLARNKGVYFLQVVKEPMPEPQPAEAPPAA